MLDRDRLLQLRDEYEQLGYEGIMIKQCSDGHAEDSATYNRSLYRSGRSVNTIKYKRFDYSECEVLNIVTSRRRNDMCTLNVRDIHRHMVFELEYGTHIQKRLWKANPFLIVGKVLPYKHKGYTDDGMPSHATSCSADAVNQP
jgi:hypothetical protein